MVHDEIVEWSREGCGKGEQDILHEPGKAVVGGAQDDCINEVGSRLDFRHEEGLRMLEIADSRSVYKTWMNTDNTRFGGIHLNCECLAHSSQGRLGSTID